MAMSTRQKEERRECQAGYFILYRLRLDDVGDRDEAGLLGVGVVSSVVVRKDELDMYSIL